MQISTPVAAVVTDTSSSGRGPVSSREHPLAAAEQDRLDHQPVLVDELVLDELAGERGAAHHDEVAARSPFIRRSSADDRRRRGAAWCWPGHVGLA